MNFKKLYRETFRFVKWYIFEISIKNELFVLATGMVVDKILNI